jgi:hypothetical protein
LVGLLLVACGGRSLTNSGDESDASVGGASVGMSVAGGSGAAPTVPADAGLGTTGPENTPGSEFTACDPDGGVACLSDLACEHVISPIPDYYLCSRGCDPTSMQDIERCWGIGGLCRAAAPGQPNYCVLDALTTPGAAGWPCSTGGLDGGSTCNPGLSCIERVCARDRLCTPPDAGIDAGVLCGASFGCLDGECVSIR